MQSVYNSYRAEWSVVHPPVYRYMARQFVDDFFNQGKLRISSFAAFKKHPDESLKDLIEGSLQHEHVSEVGDTTPGTIKFASARISFGTHDYILCGSLDAEKFEEFKHPACLVINHPHAFSMYVADQIPGFRGGMEGFCRYDGKIRTKNRGPQQFPASIDAIANWLGLRFSAEMFFYKASEHRDQREYRMVFQTTNLAQEHIDIVLPPQAIALCEPQYAPDPLGAAAAT